MARLWMILAGLNGFIAVAAGAFGFHGLADRLTDAQMTAFMLGSQFQLVHAVALIGIAWMVSRQAPLANWAGAAFMAGIILFTGSVYILWLTHSMIVTLATPVGGASYMLGWILVLLGALRDRGLSMP